MSYILNMLNNVVYMLFSLSTKNFPVAKISESIYNFLMWTCKPSDDYSLNNEDYLQATGTTHNNEKWQWYWIGTKNLCN